jgi:putative ATP-dependent endonuclease of the OLD family
MRLRALKLRNFRCYRDEFEITFGDLTALIGKNDVGKSSLLDALAIFFEAAKFEEDDRSVGAAEQVTRIGCVFDGLPQEVVLDQTATTTLAREYLLNADACLEVHRLYPGRGKPRVVAVAQHPTADGLNDLLSIKNDDLKKRVRGRGLADTVDLRSNPAKRQALWGASGDALGLAQTEIDLDTGDAKTIWAGLRPELPLFALFKSDRSSTDQDSEAQDPLKAAIREALTAEQTVLAEVMSRVRERAIEVASRTLNQLRQIDPNLAYDLSPRFSSDPKWDSIFKLSLTSDEEIPINKRGSGVRRLVLLSFFRAQAEMRRSTEGRGDAVYAVEEPETSQHPENQRRLVEALAGLSGQSGAQVILTTHVPGLAGLLSVECIRFLKRDDGGRRSLASGSEDCLRQLAQELGVVPDPGSAGSVKVIVCVEGPGDVEFLQQVARLLRTESEILPDIDTDPRVLVLPLGGSTLKDWVAGDYLRKLGRPEVHVYDRDGAETPKYDAQCREVNARGNGSRAFNTKKRELENYLPSEIIAKALGVSVTVTDDVDVPELVARALHEAVAGTEPWERLDDSTRKTKIGRAKRRLRDEVVPRLTIEGLKDRAAVGEISEWMTVIGSLLM